MVQPLLQDESLSEKLIKKGFWLYFFTLITAPTSYIIRVVVSNDMSVSDVWLFYSIISFIVILSVYNDLWLTSSLWYFLPKYRIEKKLNKIKTSIFFSLFFQITTWIIIFGILYFFSDSIAIHYFQNQAASDILKIFAVYFLWINLLQVIKTIFDSFQDVFKSRLCEFIRLGSICIFTIALFMHGSVTIMYYSIAWILWLILSIITALILFYKDYIFTLKGKIQFIRKDFKKQFNYALWILLWANATTILWQVDMQMILIMLWAESAGYYTNYLSIIGLTSILTSPLIVLLFPILRESLSKKDKKIQQIQNFFYKYFSLLSIIIWVIIFVLWDNISLILFGEKFIESWELTKYSSLFLIFNVLLGINFSIMGALWKVKETTFITLQAAWINVILNIILIQYIWILGAILSTIIGWIFMWKQSFNIIHKNKKISFDIYNFINKILLILPFSICIYYFKDSIFVTDNNYRYENLLYLLLIGIWYIIYLWFVNYREIYILKNEIITLKRK